MANKLVRGSLIIFIGNIIFRIGGYLYRFLMATLLGPTGTGILGITMSYQGIFQTLASGGLPPAISKYIAEYEAVDDHNMARQTVYTSLKNSNYWMHNSIQCNFGWFKGCIPRCI